MGYTLLRQRNNQARRKKRLEEKCAQTYLQCRAAATAFSCIPPSPFLQDWFDAGIRAEFDCILLVRTGLTGAIRHIRRQCRGQSSGGPGSLS